MNHPDNNTIDIEIVTPESILYFKQVYMAIMPGAKGEFGVSHGHMALLSGLAVGLVIIYDNSMKIIDQIFIGSGFVEISAESAILLVEKAAPLSDYNKELVINELDTLSNNLELCKNEVEMEVIKKNIDFTKTLLNFLK